MSVRLQSVSKAYGGRTVLDRFSHTFRPDTVTCVLGPSGCGKTTLLRLIAGLERPDAGTITGVPDGGIAMVFQEDRLPPQLSATDCLRSVLPRGADRDRRIAEALAALGLSDQAAQRVASYSGGMRRRVALARALLYPSPLMLLDEPFKGLDDDTRARAIAFARPRLKGRVTLLVTHDPRDADAFGGATLRLDAR